MRSRWAVRLVALAALLVLARASRRSVARWSGRLSEVQKNDNASFLPAQAESTEVMNEVAKFSDTESLPFILVMEGKRQGQRRAAGRSPEVRRRPARPHARPARRPGSLSKYLTETPKVAVPSQDGAALLLIVPMNAVTSAETIGDTSPLFAAADTLRAAAKSDLAPDRADDLRHRAGRGHRRLRHRVRRDRRHPARRRARRGLPHPAHRLPQPDPALRGAPDGGLRPAPRPPWRSSRSRRTTSSGCRARARASCRSSSSAPRPTTRCCWCPATRRSCTTSESTWVAMRRPGAVPWSRSSPARPPSSSGCSACCSPTSATPRARTGRRARHRRRPRRALTFLPAVLLLIGRAAFWPAIPQLDHVHAQDSIGRRGLWGRVAALVGSHPRRTWVLTLAGLLAPRGVRADAQGRRHQPVRPLPRQGRVGDRAGGAGRALPGGLGLPDPGARPRRARPTPCSPPLGRRGRRQRPVCRRGPGRPGQGRSTGRCSSRPRSTERGRQPGGRPTWSSGCAADLDAVGDDVLVGGQTAISLDVRDASNRDLRTIIPAILVVIFVVLALLLRSLVAPLLLVAANVVSFAATIGVAALAFNHVFDFPGSDPSTPLYGFVFLVALGIDYSIFLMTRVREESARAGHPAGRPGRAGRHRRRDHQRRHRAGLDVLGARGAADPVPRADRVHRRVRRAARHPRGALAARAGAQPRHRPADLGPERAARGKD